MTLDDLIKELKEKIYSKSSIGLLCYHYINQSLSELHQTDLSIFTGEVEKVSYHSFLEEYCEEAVLQKIKKRINIYKGLTVYHYIGLSLQDRLNETSLFQDNLKKYFVDHSIHHQYLITKIFNEFEPRLIDFLETLKGSDESFVKVLRGIYLQTSINKPLIIKDFIKRRDELDIIDLLLLEDLHSIEAIGYNTLQEQLRKDIFWCAAEIQSKHRVLNNNEDQYNSNFQSLLKAKGYKTEPQTQRGESSTGILYGELDIAIFAEDDIPLSIFEAFNINSVTSQTMQDYIETHLIKLSKKYDPNGLQNNYAVVYVKHDNFETFWNGYKSLVPTFNFQHEISPEGVKDISSRYPPLAGIKIGLSEHDNRGTKVYVYHFFMHMNYQLVI